MIYRKETPRKWQSPKVEYSFTPIEGSFPVRYALMMMYTDIEPYEIIAVDPKRKRLTVRGMSCRQINEIPCQSGGFVGYSDNSAQKWEISSDPKAGIMEISLRKNGRFYRVGSSMKGTPFNIVAEPYKFYDYNF